MNIGNNKTTVFLLLSIIFILLYLLIQNFGYIENPEVLIPTGNIDIFEIDCDCCKDDIEEKSESKVVIKPNEVSDINKNELEKVVDIEPEVVEYDIGDLYAFDDYKIWDDEDLRIFSNPAYEYRNIIAPGSKNSYAFVIRNNNDFDVIFDITFKETNDKKINMKYKLKSEGNYLIGNETTYDRIGNKKIAKVKLSAKSQIAYILDWKWVDSEKDADVGFDVDAFYKLSITIGASK